MFGLVLLGLWLSGVPALIQFAARRCETSACVGAVLAGAALIAVGSRRAVARRIAVVLASAVTMISAVTLLEYAADVDLGIDELITRGWPFEETAAHPNRMSPNAALSFLWIGPALLVASRSRRLARIGQGLALALIALNT